YSAVTLCIAVSPDRKDRSVTCGWRTAEERDMSRSGFSRMSLFSEYQSHNVRVVLVVEQVSGQKNNRLLAGVLPPVRCALDLGRRLAGLVHDRRLAGAAVFGDLAGDDVDNRRTIGMAVPGDDASGLDHEAAQPQRMILQHHRLVDEVDALEDGIRHVL